MGYERVFPISDIPGFLTCILGLVAQIFLGRRLKIPAIINWPVAAEILIIYLSTEENMIPPLRRAMPADIRTTWIPALCFVWFFCILATWFVVRLRDSVPAFRSDRRQFLQASSAAACALPAAVMTFGIITRKDFVVNEIDVKIPHLAKDLQGLRLLQLSDIHLGSFFNENDLIRVVDASNHLRADVAFVTGDLITTKHDPLDRCILQLKRLKSIAGIWGCMGNHEFYAGVADDTEWLAQQAGMKFLRHKADLLRFGDHHINLVGVDYQRPIQPYLENVEDLMDAAAFNLLLSHTPAVFDVAADKGFDLTISGHTHGGQLNLDLAGHNINVADFFTPYTKGLYTLPTSALYVNSGLGTIGMPVRVGAPPEISLIRLCNS